MTGVNIGGQFYPKVYGGTIAGPISVPLLLGVGAVLLVAFVWWQSRVQPEPLVPLSLFRDRNFSLSNVSITLMGLAINAMMFPMLCGSRWSAGSPPPRRRSSSCRSPSPRSPSHDRSAG